MELPPYESVLCEDPSHDYVRMDATSQASYRDAVEELAVRARRDPSQIAAQALALARAQCETTQPEDARRHIGYFLVAEGRAALLAALTQTAMVQPLRTSHRVIAIAGATLVAGAAFCAATLPFFHLEGFGPTTAAFAVSLLFLHALGCVSVIVNTLALAMRPRELPRLDFSAGLPADSATAVCVPTMLTDRQHVADIAATAERHWRTICDEQARIVLLTDWPDADRAAPTADEASWLEDLAERIERLNAAHGGAEGCTPFYLLHRARVWSPTEQRWMGWERKRGKLLQFNRLIAEGRHDFAQTVGVLDDLRRIVYAVVADDDTVLTPRAMQAMVGAIAHPLNRLQRMDDGDGGETIRGYGALSPALSRRDRVEQTPPPPRRLLPHKVEFDLFGECKLPGKGLYDIRLAHRQLADRFPDGCVLSHDVVESGFLRCGFDARTTFLERWPNSYRLIIERAHRWARGDFQNLWVMFRLRPIDGETRARPGLLPWFWVIQNVVLALSRVTFAALLALLMFGDPAFADRRFVALMVMDRLPDYVASAMRLVQSPPPPRIGAWLAAIGRELVNIHYFLLVRIGSAFHGGLVLADALVLTMIRIVRRRGLLEWVSSGHLERSGRRYSRLDVYNVLVPAAALGWAAWLWNSGHGAASGAAILALTVMWPVGVWAAGRQWSRPRVIGTAAYPAPHSDRPTRGTPR